MLGAVVENYIFMVGSCYNSQYFVFLVVCRENLISCRKAVTKKKFAPFTF